ncbi:MAG: DUF1990 family protein [Gemmatimonadota bacterium]
MADSDTQVAAKPIAPAGGGVGPLLQRDYWAVLGHCRGTAAEVARAVAERFWRYPPPDMVCFERVDGTTDPLQSGDVMAVEIRVAGTCHVRVVHRDELSLTLATLDGHPEAGRITFGAYPNARGEIVFHIRSRARASSRNRLLGFLTAGEPMQTLTWTGFIDRLAASVGAGVRDVIHADTREVTERAEDRCAEGLGPTFRAVDPTVAQGAGA